MFLKYIGTLGCKLQLVTKLYFIKRQSHKNVPVCNQYNSSKLGEEKLF